MYFKRTTHAVRRCKNKQHRCSYGRDRVGRGHGRRRRTLGSAGSGRFLRRWTAGFLAPPRKARATHRYFAWRRPPRDTPAARQNFQKTLDMTAYKYTALCRICAKLDEDKNAG